MRLIDAELLKKHIEQTADLGGWIGEALYQIKQVAIKYIEAAPSYETKQIKYFDEEEKVWKIGDVIVEHTERTQEEIPEYEPWRDAFDGMDCCSREVQDDNGDDID